MNKKKAKITYAADAYKKLKEVFGQFRNICTEVLSEENYFDLVIGESDDTSIEMTVFDSRILLIYSMVFDPNGIPFGKISFEKLVEDDDNQQIWTLYFDELGNLREKVSQKISRLNMLMKSHLESILINFLEIYLSLQDFQAEE
jgi:hypothetical protein